MSEASVVGADSGVWVVVPQAVSRLSAVYVFAMAARTLDAEDLGVLAIATAVTAGSVAVAPALVGKPLAVLSADDERRRLAPAAQSFAVLAAALVGLLLGLAAVLATGSARTVLVACSIGVPSAMVVESHYWRVVFLHSRRRAGLLLSAAYLAQGVAVTVGALSLPPAAVVVSPFVGLALAALFVLPRAGLSVTGARSWSTGHRPTWLPYLLGVAAAVALAQAVPIILAVTAGLAAASVYRAGELVFGVTNLLIGVVVQARLTKDTVDQRRTYLRTAVVLAVVAVANGIVVAVLPRPVLALVVGPVADGLQDVVGPFTVLRAALGVASVGSVLLLRVLSARWVGTVGVASAALSCSMLVAGALLGGLTGGVAGLAAAEIGIAVYYGVLMRRRW